MIFRIVPGRDQSTTYGTERLAAVSDGVFAIVVTLLVLSINLPEPPRPRTEILGELGDNLPDFLGWFVSFIVVARLWTIHHHVVSTMAYCRTGTVVLNFAFLGVVSLVPFGSSLIGTYGFREPIALAAFSIIFGLAALALGLFAHHAAADPRLLRPDAADLSWHWKHHIAVVPVLSIAAAGLAFVDPRVALLVFPAEAVLVVLASARKRSGSTDPAAGATAAGATPAAPPAPVRPDSLA